MNYLNNIRQFFAHQFNLQEDKADEQAIISSVKKNVDFKGANLFALVFAIFIASIGLNVNSTAVIIGAMLISPIMGPVMGIGLGVGINDFDLVKTSLRNLLIATVIAIATSSLYFFITPLHQAQSELLARTSPSIWDVFIAFFGGLAGMVAASRTEKTNVIPGVAIATALMPPLCTAGYGISTGNWIYFLGAIYLYFINSVFITIATYLMARYLKLHKKHIEAEVDQKKVRRYMIIIVVATILPSVYLAYRIVNKSIFETNARRFVEEQFHYTATQVVSHSYIYSRNNKAINILLIGKQLSPQTIDSLTKKLKSYQLQGTKLEIRQGLDARQQIDLSQIKASILEDVFSNIPKPDTIRAPGKRVVVADTAVFAELKILYPAILSFGISDIVINRLADLKKDTVKLALAKFAKPIRNADKVKLQAWLNARFKTTKVRLVVNR